MTALECHAIDSPFFRRSIEVLANAAKRTQIISLAPMAVAVAINFAKGVPEAASEVNGVRRGVHVRGTQKGSMVSGTYGRTKGQQDKVYNISQALK